jgi:hypothetical protein
MAEFSAIHMETAASMTASEWHISEELLWSAHEAVSGPSFYLLLVTL